MEELGRVKASDLFHLFVTIVINVFKLSKLCKRCRFAIDRIRQTVTMEI